MVCVCVVEDEYDSEDEEDEEERRRAQEARDHLASVAKLQITAAATPDSMGKKGKGRVVKMEMPAESTLGELFRALQDDEVCGSCFTRFVQIKENGGCEIEDFVLNVCALDRMLNILG